MAELFTPRRASGTIPMSAVPTAGWNAWLKRQPKPTKTWLQATDFRPERGRVALVPDKAGKIGRVVLGLGDRPDLWAFAAVPGKVPPGRYAFDDTLPATSAEAAALGWGLADYRFDRYRTPSEPHRTRTLVWPAGIDKAGVERMLGAIALGRDLINTPAEDLGPAELADAMSALGKRHGAKVTVIRGDALLEKGYPAIHIVGRGSERAPCLVDLRWGPAKAPKVTLVGKGVCFDTGGYDLKNSAGMRLMKKDMGGAASVLALADLVMGAGLPVRLRVLVPAVENSVSGRAYRPGDVISTRKGKRVEIGNTDAEGRVILCDALTEADSEDPELLLDFATLTGAARVALGTELPALFCDDDALCDDVLAAGRELDDPMWRMPLHTPYRRHLDSKIADLNNVASVGTGGAITAALYLKEFVSAKRRWAHVDTMAWMSSSKPGRPEGGDVFGVRAFFSVLATRYGSGT
jgi:leucyl aminopeptidase